MSYQATVFNVMLASPADVRAEREIAREAIYEWNVLHSQREGCVLLPTGWESHASSGPVGRPQEIINKQVLEDADLLIAMFWTRLGTSTGQTASGTVEEIEEHVNAQKPAMLFFSNAPVRPDSVDDTQYQALRAFRDEYKRRGLITEYGDIAEFRRGLERQLHLTVTRELCVSSDAAFDEFRQTIENKLSDDASQLLFEAARDQNGIVMVVRTLAGTQIQTNNIEFVEHGDPRSEARWEEVVQDLLSTGLLTGSGSSVFRVTAAGYRLAGEIEERRRGVSSDSVGD